MDAITVAHKGHIQIIDSTSVRAHKQVATAMGVQITVKVDRAAGSRLRSTSSSTQALPIRLGLTAGQTHDGQMTNRLLDHLGPHTIILADKAYDTARIR